MTHVLCRTFYGYDYVKRQKISISISTVVRDMLVENEFETVCHGGYTWCQSQYFTTFRLFSCGFGAQ
jgi:hypothetical protein